MIQKSQSEIMKNWQGDPDCPLVSIRCTAYNHEKYIEQCLDGFLMQETTFPFEAIVHDDASTDQTAGIIRKYEERYPKIIRPVYETENQYSKQDGSLRRVMNAYCTGKYMALCEGDDYWTDPEKLQRQISFLEEYPDYSMIFHAVDYVIDGKAVSNDRRSAVECDFSTEDIIRGGGDFCATASLCLRSGFFLDRYEFQKHADVGDYPMQIAMALRGKIHYIPDTMAAYRDSSGNNTSWTARTLSDKEKRDKHYKVEISWLTELDEFTNAKYRDAINYRIAIMSFKLFKDNALSLKDMKIIMDKLNDRDRMMIEKEVLRFRVKESIKKGLPFIYIPYKKIKDLTGSERKN